MKTLLGKKEKILIAHAWPYANGRLHLGHLSGPSLSADIFARFKRATGYDVLMVSGSDMHGTPITVTAVKEGIAPADVAQKYHELIKHLNASLDMSFDIYTSTATQNHKEVVQAIFLDLYHKKCIREEEMLQAYCEKDKRFLPDRYVEGICPFCGYDNARGDQCDECGKTLDPSELIDPRCKFCGTKPVFRPTKHFFLDLPLFQKRLEEYVSKQKHWRPNAKQFTLAWLREGLRPRPITRDLDYGIPVPLESYRGKVIYVWFEAVIGYYSATIEWAKGKDKKNYLPLAESFWKGNVKSFYFMGKDNIPFHSIIWPAMLMGYDPQFVLPYDIVANELLTFYGKQMSKSRKLYVDAQDAIDTYGSDAVRFYVAANLPENHDTDFTWEQFESTYNNKLVANIGNFINRVLVFTNKSFEGIVPQGKVDAEVKEQITRLFRDIATSYEQIHITEAVRHILALSQFGNQYFDKAKPWKSIKEDKQAAANCIYSCIQIASVINLALSFVTTKASKEIAHTLEQDLTAWKIPSIKGGTRLRDVKIYFPKIEVNESTMEHG